MGTAILILQQFRKRHISALNVAALAAAIKKVNNSLLKFNSDIFLNVTPILLS